MWLSPHPPSRPFIGDLLFVVHHRLCVFWGKMKKFNIRKVLDGLTAVSSSTASPQPGNRENDLIQETLQSEHFQLCKVGETDILMCRVSY